MSEADLIRLLNEDREKLRGEVAASHEESRTLAIQLTERQKEVAELRARIEAAIDYFESDAWERVEPGELRRILHGE